jgi:hypothetical protein
MRVTHRHEPVDIYGTAVKLPRLTWTRRAMWWVLLTLARFDWGQALIRRARGL